MFYFFCIFSTFQRLIQFFGKFKMVFNLIGILIAKVLSGLIFLSCSWLMAVQDLICKRIYLFFYKLGPIQWLFRNLENHVSVDFFCSIMELTEFFLDLTVGFYRLDLTNWDLFCKIIGLSLNNFFCKNWSY